MVDAQATPWSGACSVPVGRRHCRANGNRRAGRAPAPLPAASGNGFDVAAARRAAAGPAAAMAMAIAALRRTPARPLPAQLLETATRKPTSHAALLPGLSERGHWLAARYDDWLWARRQHTDEEAIWDTGSLDERIGILRARRACDPDAARTCWPLPRTARCRNRMPPCCHNWPSDSGRPTSPFWKPRSTTGARK